MTIQTVEVAIVGQNTIVLLKESVLRSAWCTKQVSWRTKRGWV